VVPLHGQRDPGGAENEFASFDSFRAAVVVTELGYWAAAAGSSIVGQPASPT
jgi:hypothetical protein